MSKPYARIADKVAERIASGELTIGARLPPQRTFAYEEGIAVSTASRVYDELRRRGLVVGEVGRGTFVANRFFPIDPALQEPTNIGLDLEIVFRLGEGCRKLISASTSRFFRAGLNEESAAPPSTRGHETARCSLAKHLSTPKHAVDPESVLFAGNGKQAIMAALSALAPRGGRIAVEELTYPFVIGAARLLGIELVALPVDEEGVTPDSLAKEAKIGLDGVYLQPTLQSPLVITMSQARREAIADILKTSTVAAIEDRVYAFMRNTPPLATHAPDHVIQIDSLSKRLMPGMAIGMIVSPDRFQSSLARSLRSGGWMAPSLSIALAKHWIDDGVVHSVEGRKKQEASAMYGVAKGAFAGVDFRGAEDALHAWIGLSKPWRGEAFAAAAAKLGIAVAPGSLFAVTPGVAPSAVRVAYSAPDLKTWEFAVTELGRIARQPPVS